MKYVIVSTTRSGTRYLCNALSALDNNNYCFEELMNTTHNRSTYESFSMLSQHKSWACTLQIDRIFANYDQSDLLLSQLDVTKVFLYRKDIEEMLLSRFYDQHTPVYNSGEHKPIINKFIDFQLKLQEFYLLHKWDKQYVYENFTTDPLVDFQDMVYTNDLQRLNRVPRKAANKLTKIQYLTNYNEFKDDFDHIISQRQVNPHTFIY